MGPRTRKHPLPQRKTAIIISLTANTTEMEELARSMNYEVREVFVQRRRVPHPKFFLGKGKVGDIGRYLKQGDGAGIEVAIVNSPLKPAQIFQLQTAWGITVFDRTRLILEIFSNRAKSQEARYQVELARLEYEVPLVKELIHRTRMGEHPGYMAGGEYQVDQYYVMIRKRIKRIKAKLGSIKKDRSEKRRRRREEGFFLISIAGYTNAGKSMLLRSLTKEDVIIEQEMFSTLVTLTRKGSGKKGGAFLFSDTVGFIKDLPPWLLEAFHSTLEEIVLADLVLLVVDANDDESTIIDRLLTSYRFLLHERTAPPIVLVFNKIDLVADRVLVREKISSVLSCFESKDISFLDHHCISAMSGEGVDSLLEGMFDSLSRLEHVSKMVIDIDRAEMNIEDGELERFMNWIFGTQIVLSSIIDEHRTSFVIICKRQEVGKINKYLESLGIIGR